jgi:ribosomal protein S19
VGVYNGKKIIFFSVKKAMSGKKFGEFAVTKVLGPQVINKKKKKDKNLWVI